MAGRLLLLAAACLALGIAGASSERVLVILEDLAFKQSHSLFFSSLKSRGHQLDFKSAADASLKLRDYDKWLYDKIVIFASDISEFNGEVDAGSLVEFIDDGGSLLLAVDSRVSEELRDFAMDVGVDLEPRGSAVFDHWHYATNLGADRAIIASTDATTSKAVLRTPLEAPVLFKGVGITVSPDSELVLPALTASRSALSAGGPARDAPAGDNIVLVALVQARNNARVLVSGSLDLFSDKFFLTPVATPDGKSHARSGNAAFALEVSRWAFGEQGVLVASNLSHTLVEGGPPAGGAAYRINDIVRFSIDLHQRDGAELVPFSADDVQVELVMLDPYVRQALVPDGKGTFSADVHTPDVYGVFKFVVDYRRPGYSYIHLEEQVPIRPFRHDEYERFIVAAYPYYASAFSMMAGFFVLAALVLYSK